MRFDKRKNDITKQLWHDHYTWLPTLVGGTWVWLETVKRKGTLHTLDAGFRTGPDQWWQWQYMLPEDWGR
jgi:hypothetical protein